MKILSILGSPRQKYSHEYTHIVKNFLAKHTEVDFQEIFLKDLPIDYCIGCYKCMKFGEEKCGNADIIHKLLQSIDEADGVIFSSPIYVDNVNAIMKNFIDHFAFLLHRPRFFGKKAIIIVSTLETGIKQVSKYLINTISHWGFDIVGSLGIKVKGFEENFKQNEKYMARLENLSNKFAHSIQNNTSYPPKMADLVFFHIFKVLVEHTKSISPADYEYWKSKQWLQKSYFQDIPLNPLSLLVANLIAQSVKQRIQRNAKQKIILSNYSFQKKGR
jgi:multimeric flavodoxin WrbA